MIEQGWLSIEGQRVKEQGVKILYGQSVTVDAQGQKWLNRKKTVILHKPPGYVSHLPEENQIPAVRLITRSNFYGPGKPEVLPTRGLAPAGRLDIDSTGLLVLTQSGPLAKKIIGENSSVEKEYIVKVSGTINQAKLAKLSFGLELDGEKLKKAGVERINQTQLKFVLTQGKKRQIRRMCELVDLQVMTLKRIRIGGIRLASLPRGQWRFLLPSELS